MTLIIIYSNLDKISNANFQYFTRLLTQKAYHFDFEIMKRKLIEVELYS